MCDKFRDVSLSRALALTNQIKGNSILNVEATYAFPSGSCQSFMPNGNLNSVDHVVEFPRKEVLH